MIQALQLNGAPVTTPVINAVVKGIVMAIDRTILVEHGMSLSYDWVRNVLYSMGREGKKMRFIVDMCHVMDTGTIL